MIARSGVAVVIPAYSPGDNFEQALEGALSQSQPTAEIVVVDDGFAEPIAVASPRVRVIRQDNGGPGSARNRGVAHINRMRLGNSRLSDPCGVCRPAAAFLARPEAIPDQTWRSLVLAPRAYSLVRVMEDAARRQQLVSRDADALVGVYRKLGAGLLATSDGALARGRHE